MKTTLDHPGDTLTYRTGRITITLQWLETGPYTVTTYRGVYRIEDQCGSYDTEAEARAVARAWATLAKTETETEPAGLDAYVQGRTNVPTIGGRHTTKTSDPMDIIILTAARLGGTIGRSRDCTSTQINALIKRGMMDPVRPTHGPKYGLVGGSLTARGRRRAAELVAPAEPDLVVEAIQAALSA
jgi:hypothetical protein